MEVITDSHNFYLKSSNSNVIYDTLPITTPKIRHFYFMNNFMICEGLEAYKLFILDNETFKCVEVPYNTEGLEFDSILQLMPNINCFFRYNGSKIRIYELTYDKKSKSYFNKFINEFNINWYFKSGSFIFDTKNGIFRVIDPIANTITTTTFPYKSYLRHIFLQNNILLVIYAESYANLYSLPSFKFIQTITLIYSSNVQNLSEGIIRINDKVYKCDENGLIELKDKTNLVHYTSMRDAYYDRLMEYFNNDLIVNIIFPYLYRDKTCLIKKI